MYHAHVTLIILCPARDNIKHVVYVKCSNLIIRLPKTLIKVTFIESKQLRPLFLPHWQCILQ